MGLMVGEPSNFAVPVCMRVVQFDLGMTNPTGGDRDVPPVVSPLAGTLPCL
jgi:hypothetical protein